MSCSPIGKFNDVSRYWSHGWNAYHKVCQDAQGWLKDGLMDELYPMMYFKDNQFYPFAIDWFENSYGKTVAPGLGIYFMDPKEKNWDLDVITRQLYVLRQYKLGNAYFRSKFFTDNLKGLYTFVAQDYNRFPALVPAMTWKSAVPPTAPLQLEADTLRGVLRWLEGKDNSHAPYLLYNVYADTSYPVNTNDAGNLVAVRLRERQISASMRRGLYYAVTAIDRYGNESSAVQLPVSTPKMSLAAPSLLLHNGSVLPIPAIDGVVPRYVAIETMQGTVLASRVVRQGGVPIGDLRAGMYVVRVLKKHAKGSVAGYFSIER